jgi:hypothetical protein
MVSFSSCFSFSSFSLPFSLRPPTPHRDEERAVVGVERHVAEGKQREDDDLEEEGRDEAAVSSVVVGVEVDGGGKGEFFSFLFFFFSLFLFFFFTLSLLLPCSRRLQLDPVRDQTRAGRDPDSQHQPGRGVFLLLEREEEFAVRLRGCRNGEKGEGKKKARKKKELTCSSRRPGCGAG